MHVALRLALLVVIGNAALATISGSSAIAAPPEVQDSSRPVPVSPAHRDWPQLGGSPARNNVAPNEHLPIDWDAGKFDSASGKPLPNTARNIRWTVPLDAGSWPYHMASGPAVSGGKVFVGSNNHLGYVARLPKNTDLACLLCFRDTDGAFLWQFASERLPTGRSQDWSLNALSSTPLIEGDRLWMVTNRDEVVCLDTEGFLDHENDGPFRDEPNENADEADVVWKFDMVRELGVSPHNIARSSITAAGDVLFVCTSNGVDESHVRLPAPNAPCFLAMNKTTGKLLWSDSSPGSRIAHGQWSSPAFGELAGKPQAIFAGGDGWLYGFLGAQTADGRSDLLWKFDCNSNRTFPVGGRPIGFDYVMTSAVIWDGRVYAAVGEVAEHGEGLGCLWCLDPSKPGDVSSEINLAKNPKSAVVWKFESVDDNGNGQIEFSETMHRAIGTPAIADGLLVIADFSGLVHCLDAKTGRRHWWHDTLAACGSTPLIAGGHIYIGNEDGNVAVFKLSTEKQIVTTNEMPTFVLGAPAAVNGTLYLLTRSHLFAIARPAP